MIEERKKLELYKTIFGVLLITAVLISSTLMFIHTFWLGITIIITALIIGIILIILYILISKLEGKIKKHDEEISLMFNSKNKEE